ncbi:hypothetical protein SAMN05421505_13242 [Sinosporangium album]|uniref:Uncharacterized protein n=1 Tax=Sinosporangium album TaxID=504805 RepID=A0A1G8HI30_9ACTN|nr:DUF5947 family protein [Sinosporangium album]SDI06334.1 hypothetical protein SAMN05421505_13242 [Sinosporangium album]
MNESPVHDRPVHDRPVHDRPVHDRPVHDRSADTPVSRGRSGGLRRFRERPPADVQRCEMCAEPIGDAHRHVVNLESRALMCTCRGCALLFTREGAAGGRLRAVPDRFAYAPALGLSPQDWDELQIPVRMAFFFHNSSLGHTIAFYPSPGGATESQLPLAAWERLLAERAAVADVEPDVEALLFDEDACYLVPIDTCYELVGLVRMHWRGFDGGQEAREAIAGFFARLRARGRAVPGGER